MFRYLNPIPTRGGGGSDSALHVGGVASNFPVVKFPEILTNSVESRGTKAKLQKKLNHSIVLNFCEDF